MERDKVSKLVKEMIFKNINGLNGFRRASQISEDCNLVVDLAMDSLDFVEVVIAIEERTGIIPDEFVYAKPYNELDVKGFVDMLYGYLKDK